MGKLCSCGCRAREVWCPLTPLITALQSRAFSPSLCQLQAQWAPVQWRAQPASGPGPSDCHGGTGRADYSSQYNSGVPQRLQAIRLSLSNQWDQSQNLPLGTAAAAQAPRGMSVSVDRSSVVCFIGIFRFIFFILLQDFVGPSPTRLPLHQGGIHQITSKAWKCLNKAPVP